MRKTTLYKYNLRSPVRAARTAAHTMRARPPARACISTGRRRSGAGHRPAPCARGGVDRLAARGLGESVCCGTLRCYARWRPQALVVLSRGDDDVISPPPLFQARR